MNVRKKIKIIKMQCGSLYFRIYKLLISDKKVVERRYKKTYGKNIDWDNLESFTDKLLFLKLHYRNPLMTLCTDKAYAGEYVSACGYSNILRKFYGIYRNADQIEIDKMPSKFFVRCNHMSGYNFIVDKEKSDIKYLQKILNIVNKRNYYYMSREWQYKNLEPCIICEELLTNTNNKPLVDYKFYCFSGKPRYFMVSKGEFEHKVRNHKFNMKKESIDHYFKEFPTLPEHEVEFPDNFEKMVEIVNVLCKPFPHVRVDLYNIDGRIIFGEMTFFSNSGFVNVFSEKYNKNIGAWIDLEKYKFDLV